MKKIADLQDLMIEQLREIYDAEVQLIPFIKKLAFEVSDEKLKELLVTYDNNTADNQLILKQVFNDLFTQKRGEKNTIMRRMIYQTEELSDRCIDYKVKDAAIITSVQHIIHFKIATYGAAATYANIMGLYDDATKLHNLLELEKRMDTQLKVLADAVVDRKAYLEEV